MTPAELQALRDRTEFLETQQGQMTAEIDRLRGILQDNEARLFDLSATNETLQSQQAKFENKERKWSEKNIFLKNSLGRVNHLHLALKKICICNWSC